MILIILSLSMYDSRAQTSSYGKLQAAYVFNFAKYIKWPENIKVLTIGVYGESEIIEELRNTLKEKKAGVREIELKQLTSIDMARECNMVYISESNSKDLAPIRAAVMGMSILIVTEEDLIKKGAAISFVVEDDRLRFKLKKSALSEIGLGASEGLLKLAILL